MADTDVSHWIRFFEFGRCCISVLGPQTEVPEVEVFWPSGKKQSVQKYEGRADSVVREPARR